MHELQAIVEENSAVLGKDELLRLYHEATAEPYSFLYIDTYGAHGQGHVLAAL